MVWDRGDDGRRGRETLSVLSPFSFGYSRRRSARRILRRAENEVLAHAGIAVYVGKWKRRRFSSVQPPFWLLGKKTAPISRARASSRAPRGSPNRRERLPGREHRRRFDMPSRPPSGRRRRSLRGTEFVSGATTLATSRQRSLHELPPHCSWWESLGTIVTPRTSKAFPKHQRSRSSSPSICSRARCRIWADGSK